MATSLDNLITHFRNSNQQNIIAAGEALANGNFEAFESVVNRVAQLEVTASISNRVNSSSAALKEFLVKVESEFDPQAIKFVFGGVLSGVGGAVLAEAAGLAAAVGVSVLMVEVIAVVLILWGLSIMLPIIWRLALDKIHEAKQSLSFE